MFNEGLAAGGLRTFVAFMSGLEMKAVITALHHRDQSASWVYIYRVDTSTLSL